MNYKLFFLFSLLLGLIYNSYSQKKGISTIGIPNSIVYDICFTKGGTLLALTENKSVAVYDVEGRKKQYALNDGHTKEVLSIDISADSSKIVSGGKDSLIIVWDLNTKTIVKKLNFHKGIITTVKFHPLQNIIAIGTSDNSVLIYNLDIDSVIYSFTDHTADVTSVAFNNVGNMLATTGEDKSIILYNTTNGKIIKQLTEHKSLVRSVSFSPDDSRLLSCDDSGRLIIWKTENIENILKLDNNKYSSSWIFDSNYHFDNKTIVLGGMDGNVRIISPFLNIKYHLRFPVFKVLFKPNEANYIKVAVATMGGGVFMIDAREAKTN